MKQIICDKCGEKLINSMINTNKINNSDLGGMEDVFGNLSEMLGGMGINNKPSFIKELEGSKLIINLPKHKIKKDFDLCDKCTKEHLKYLKSLFPEWKKEK